MREGDYCEKNRGRRPRRQMWNYYLRHLPILRCCYSRTIIIRTFSNSMEGGLIRQFDTRRRTPCRQT